MASSRPTWPSYYHQTAKDSILCMSGAGFGRPHYHGSNEVLATRFSQACRLNALIADRAFHGDRLV
jgi:hypothetical protein